MQIEPLLEVSTWILVALLCIALGGGVAAWLVVASLRRAETQLAPLARIEEIQAQIARLAREEEGLDLRRIEHVLLDVRDHLKRLEERLLTVVEARVRESLATGDQGRALVPATGDGGALADRIVTRLLALGYERVVLVTPTSELQAIALAGGSVVVEARRDGAACKGRILVQDGRIADVQIQSAYSTFP